MDRRAAARVVRHRPRPAGVEEPGGSTGGATQLSRSSGEAAQDAAHAADGEDGEERIDAEVLELRVG